MIIQRGITFDDVVLVPNYCDIPSRGLVNTFARLGPYTFAAPIISANMDTITGPDMAIAMNCGSGGLGILHRFLPVEDNARDFERVRKLTDHVGVSVGVSEFETHRAEALIAAGARLICVDVAHGHSKLVGKMLKTLRLLNDDLFIIAGNVCCMAPETPVLTRDLQWAEVGKLKVGQRIMGFEETPFNGRRRRWQEATVTHTGLAIKPLYEVELASGEKFRVTGDHRWLVYDGYKQNRVWLRTDWMKTRLCYKRFRAARLVKPWTEGTQNFELGYLSGAFDGEGCLSFGGDKKRLSKSVSLSFRQNENAMLEKVCNILSHERFDYHIDRDRSCRAINIRGGFSEKLRFLGQARPPRLLEKWLHSDVSSLSTKVSDDNDRIPIVGIREIGNGEIVTLSSSSETYIAAGYGVHNTYAGADYLAACGADAIKVGIGPGSVCTTRVKTGCGVPQLSAIFDCARVARPIIADGGIRTPGDMVKALAAGASMVMIGGLLAGTQETPKEGNTFRGSASQELHDEMHDKGMPDWKTAEGVSVPLDARRKFSVHDVIRDMVGGLRSGMTYCGARDLSELKAKAQFMEVTSAGVAEGTAHFAERGL